MTPQEQHELDIAYEALGQHYEEERKKQDSCLAIVKSNFNDEDYEEIIEYIEECGSTGDFKIINEKPKFEPEKHDTVGLGLWVDQYCNGGYVGDDFAGWIYIKINETEFLKFHYNM